jgi:D-proline reductase (dithiol) PrdB
MPRLDQLSEIQKNTLIYFPCIENDDAPWTPWNKELSQSKVAIVTTAGLHMRSDAPFAGGDSSYRAIPSDADTNDIIQSHVSIGFDHTGIYRDLNLAFPIDRLQELAERGEIGGLPSHHYSFMGAQRNPQKIIEETAPEVADILKADGVDLVLLTPV